MPAVHHEIIEGSPGTGGAADRVVLLRPDGQIIASAEVGSLPDMVTFDATGLCLLVANEGEPNSYGQPNSYDQPDSYGQPDSVDPQGTISVVDALALAHGVQDAVRTN